MSNLPTETPKVLELPILKHFEKSEISLNPQNWRKGEKGIAGVLGLALLAVAGWGIFTYVLPVVLTMVGKVLGAILSAVLVIGFFVMLPVIIKALKKLARLFHKMLIRYDPFGELEEQKNRMVQNRQHFKDAKAKIRSIKTTMEGESAKSEKEAEEYQQKVVLLQERAAKMKAKITQLDQTKGEAAKETDEYVDLQTELMKTLSDAQRTSHLLNQSTGLVRKYGTRAHVIGKLDRKLNVVATAIDIKIADFEVSIDMLKKESAFAQAARNATEQAKSAMLFTKGWELDYALDVVTSTIAMDLATTRENLLDIDSLTSQYSLDSDELYSKLEKLADQIKTDTYDVPEAKKYANPNYKLSEQDKTETQGFGDIFK
ncbi:hypothetical protein WSM22_35080 [Cytophagales bacterium WSM2-2]|nr:hypothetical protein WSM22_35080 [Cytophagales bacterium WSM2-2]